MKYKFSLSSLEKLNTCHRDLRAIFNEVLKYIDCTVLCGYRGKEEQNNLYEEGKSRLMFPCGRHNEKPSMAIDVAPYPIDWDDIRRFYYFGGFVLAIGKKMHENGLKHRLRWGGDWNMNHKFKDQDFNDLVHFELRE